MYVRMIVVVPTHSRITFNTRLTFTAHTHTHTHARPTGSNQWNPSTPVLIPSKAIFAELCIMQVVTGYLLRATEEDQAQQLNVFGGLGGFP